MQAAKPGTLSGRAMSIAARRNAAGHARRFISGTTTREVFLAAARERRRKRTFTLDLLGEAVTSDKEAEEHFAAYCELIDKLADKVREWPHVPQLDESPYGALPRLNVSIKLSSLDAHYDPIDFDGVTNRVGGRLAELLRLARRRGAFINVDMESYATKDLTLHIFQHVLDQAEFRDLEHVGIVIQAYLQDSGRDLESLRDWAQRRGTPIWVRLVKGAYWDYETIHAVNVGWPIPVYSEKWRTDENYERMTRFLIASHEHLRPALGSHNLRSLAHGIVVANHLGLPKSALELQMLYGMADAEKQALVDAEHRLRIYMPYGELIPGMAYLVRRLLENTSNDSFLRAGFMEHVPIETLMKPPSPHSERAKMDQGPHVKKPSDSHLAAFHNEPTLDFALASNREETQRALRETAERFGRQYPLVIGGQEVETLETIVSLNPSHKSQVVGQCASASVEHAKQAVAAAKKALPSWGATSVEERADFLRKAAERMRARRGDLTAWMIHECGKPWREADADVCEAIDFCEYYAAGALDMYARSEVNLPGEENEFDYLPRGVAAVIAPWNFPLAILTGMTTAALVTGNTVVMKPAEQSPVAAAKLMEIFREIEVPDGVVNYLPGKGETAGAALVEHRDVALVAFTGSRGVGLAINNKAAEISAKGAPQVKRVIAEMGGKNAIIVDDDADLDEAVSGVVQSAFNYAGQKCSACSRVIVLNAVYDTFTARLVEAANSLRIGPAENPGTHMGPVIDDEALRRIHDYITIGGKEGRVLLATENSNLMNEGYFAGPHIFAVDSPKARIAQEEIFGPVLTVLRAKSFDEAIAILNDTQYGLTAGVYSRSPSHLAQARNSIRVGNLYLNRGITGALVGRQPFGGFKMSGMGSKAGGPEYLHQFVVPRTITENTLRRGFAPTAD
jgi:RHH-type proline utilization regulon transcriptional repressor/proline dehydrogenase/delta 1-pyrroline-5-carboxylate dehydrogenase